MQTVRVLLVDDHNLFREGLALIFAATPDFEVVGEAEDGQSALIQAEALKPDLILMDIQMPVLDGLEATRLLKRKIPAVIIVILTGRYDQAKVTEALIAGASGYFCKDIRSVKLLDLLRSALSHAANHSLFLIEHGLCACQSQNQTVASGSSFASLTRREMEIVALVTQHASDKEIAGVLHLSLHTVKTHMRHIFAKLQVKRRQDVLQMVENAATSRG